jgi:hypothetical protein
MTGLAAAQAGASVPLQVLLGLGALPSAVGCARLHARNVMYEWNLPSVADTVELVVSELVTNAVRASTGPDISCQLETPHPASQHPAYVRASTGQD